MNALILAAGFGTRLKPLTDNTPKALLEINGKTLLEYSILKLQENGFNNLIINVHHLADQIISYLKNNQNFGCNIIISDERDLLLDTGGALKNIKDSVDLTKPILVYNVDIMTNLNLADFYSYHSHSNSFATLAVRKRKTNRYLLLDDEMVLCGWINKITNERKIIRREQNELHEFAFSGIHVVSPLVFNFMPKENRFSIIDLYLNLADDKKIIGFDHSDTIWMDVGKPGNIKEAEQLQKTFKNNDRA